MTSSWCPWGVRTAHPLSKRGRANVVDCRFTVSDGLLYLLLVVIVKRPVATSLQKKLLIKAKNATIVHFSNVSPNSPYVGVSHTTD